MQQGVPGVPERVDTFGDWPPPSPPNKGTTCQTATDDMFIQHQVSGVRLREAPHAGGLGENKSECGHSMPLVVLGFLHLYFQIPLLKATTVLRGDQSGDKWGI